MAAVGVQGGSATPSYNPTLFSEGPYPVGSREYPDWVLGQWQTRVYAGLRSLGLSPRASWCLIIVFFTRGLDIVNHKGKFSGLLGDIRNCLTTKIDQSRGSKDSNL